MVLPTARQQEVLLGRPQRNDSWDDGQKDLTIYEGIYSSLTIHLNFPTCLSSHTWYPAGHHSRWRPTQTYIYAALISLEVSRPSASLEPIVYLTIICAGNFNTVIISVAVTFTVTFLLAILFCSLQTRRNWKEDCRQGRAGPTA